MARSLEDLTRETERNRADLTNTVDQLRAHLSYTAEDLRQKVSPQHIKAEVSDYISEKTHGWLDSLKQQAMDHPLQAVAAGSALAVPMLRLARGFPPPLLMITAGLALTSRTLRGRAAEAASPAIDTAGEMMNEATERAQAIVGQVRDTVSSAQNQVADLAKDARSSARNLADNVSTRAANTTGALTDNIKETVSRARSAAEETIDAARDTAAAAPEKARQMIGDNAALIGGIGIAIGAIIAAALPKTDAEAKAMGSASESVKRSVDEAAQSGFSAVKDKAMSAADAATKSLAESDLGAHASRMTQNLAGSLKDSAEDVASAAFNPSRIPNT